MPEAQVSEHAQFWAGPFGDQYTARNRVDWRGRINFWHTITDITGARSVWEVGCNAGWNLSAIKAGCDYPITVGGNDVNAVALGQASTAGGIDALIVEDALASLHAIRAHELVFTAGVLIHIPPKEIAEVMAAIADASSDYVLAVEYEGNEEVVYRGHADRLWRRPYGALYEALGLTMVSYGTAPGFDNCTYWLLQK